MNLMINQMRVSQKILKKEAQPMTILVIREMMTQIVTVLTTMIQTAQTKVAVMKITKKQTNELQKKFLLISKSSSFNSNKRLTN